MPTVPRHAATTLARTCRPGARPPESVLGLFAVGQDSVWDRETLPLLPRSWAFVPGAAHPPPPRLVTAHVACRPPEVRTPGQSGEGRLLPAALGPPRGVGEAGGWLACAQGTPRPPGCGWEPSCHLGSFVSPDEPAFIFVLRLRQVMCDTLARGQCSRLCGRGDPRSPAAPPPSAPRPQPGGCAVGRLQRSARRGRPGLLSPCFRRRLHRATWPPESLWKVDAPPSRVDPPSSRVDPPPSRGLFRPRFPRAPWWLCCLKRPERHAGAPSSPCVASCG